MYRNVDLSTMLLFIGIEFLCSVCGETSLFGRQLPCQFLDSIDISSGVFHSNRSITFNGMEFPETQYTEVNYILENATVSVENKRHFRGCPCNIKPCVRLCCPYGWFVESISIVDGNITCRKNEAAKRFYSEIIDDKNQTKIVRLDQVFGFVNRICKFHYFAEGFKLTDKGEILFENRLLNHREYCLNINNATLLEAMECYDEVNETKYQYHIRYSILPYTMMISIPLLVLTFLAYICIPELMNLLGKCLLFYLISLSVLYASMSYVYLNAGIEMLPLTRKCFAYLIYVSYLSAILWLNAISFDLWMSFRSIIRLRKQSDHKQLCKYLLYVYTISALITAIAATIDAVDSIPESYKPGFGTENGFLKEESISKLLFFYVPVSVIHMINVLFFILTAVKIRQVQRDLKIYFQTKSGKSAKHQNNFDHKKYSFTLFLRLFCMMGITSSMDAISFVAQDSILFLISDYVGSLQGVFIFILFVLKRSVLNLIKQRFAVFIGKDVQKSNTAVSNSSCTSGLNDIRLRKIPLNGIQTD